MEMSDFSGQDWFVFSFAELVCKLNYVNRYL